MNFSLNFLRKDILVACAEIYLLLPVLLWIATWFIPAISLPICLGLLAVLIRHLLYGRGEMDSAAPSEISLRRLLVCLAAAAAFTFFIGFDGRVNQTGDLVVRNAIYSELIASAWPLVLPNGDFVVYSLQYWLPPALLASWFPDCQTLILQAWYFVGLSIAFLLLCCRMGAKMLLLLLLLCTFVVPLSCKLEVTGFFCSLCFWMADCSQIYHFFVMSLIMLALYEEKSLSSSRLLFCSALFFICAPLTAIFFAPLVLWRIFVEARRCGGRAASVIKILAMPELYVGGLVVLCGILYFRSGTHTHIVDILTASLKNQTDFQQVVQAIVCGFILLQVQPYVIYLLTREKILLYVMGYGTFCYAVCFTGNYVINEALFKFTVPYTYFCTWCMVKHFRQTQVRIVAIALLLLSLPWMIGMLFVNNNWKNLPRAFRDGFSVQTKNIRNEWGGTLYHPGDGRYRQLVSDSVPTPWLYRCGERSNCQSSSQKP